jgi:hypothetical protein
MSVVPLACMASTIIAPVMFPKVFWKTTDGVKMKILFYHVSKSSENPYMEESIEISIYDPDEQQYYNMQDVSNDDDSYEELTNLITKLAAGHDEVYLVTYNIEYKETSFKLIMEEYFNDTSIQAKFMDLKQLFYYMHPQIAKISYRDILDFYRIQSLDNKALEYCMMMEHIVEDHDINIRKDMEKFRVLYNHVHPVIA